MKFLKRFLFLALSFQLLVPSSWATYQPTITVGSSALPTGAATETTLSELNGKVTAVNTGAVVVSSSALPTGASSAANQVSGGPQTGSGVVTGTTQRVTLATDGPGVSSLSSIANNTAGGAVSGASLVSSTANEASRVIKASAGTLISLVGYNARASAQFIQLFNSATVPADTAVPIYTFMVPASANFSLDVPVSGIPFTTGIAVSNSSTQATKTIGSADCWFTAVIK
jgi:hypothetical protein